jgi:hypothetical protein
MGAAIVFSCDFAWELAARPADLNRKIGIILARQVDPDRDFNRFGSLGNNSYCYSITCTHCNGILSISRWTTEDNAGLTIAGLVFCDGQGDHEYSGRFGN